MSLHPCPFCGRDVAAQALPRRVLFAHHEPMCEAWDRVVYVGGFSEAERDTFNAFILSEGIAPEESK